MPWDPNYRKQGVQGITANAIDVVIETGDSGPVTPIGINLPNDQSVREQYGSKSVSLSNMHEVIGHASGKVDERLKGNPQAVLKEQFSALEEARADLVALYFLPDPKLAELGLVNKIDQDEIV